jgi:hypothetical protein
VFDFFFFLFFWGGGVGGQSNFYFHCVTIVCFKLLSTVLLFMLIQLFFQCWLYPVEKKARKHVPGIKVYHETYPTQMYFEVDSMLCYTRGTIDMIGRVLK